MRARDLVYAAVAIGCGLLFMQPFTQAVVSFSTLEAQGAALLCATAAGVYLGSQAHR